MAPISTNNLHGIWAGITLSWDENFAFDEKTFSRNVERTIADGVHGIYTTGSTGEFYALRFSEFCRMVDIIAEKCLQAGMPLQVGCCSDSTSRTIRLIEYAAEKKAVSTVQVALPYWMRLTDSEILQFFNDLHSACPEVYIVHYNIGRAKRFLHAEDYLKVLEVCPMLIGVKYTFAGAHFSELQDDILKTPTISYFVSENLLVSAMLLGARGCYSSLVATNAQFMLEMYEKSKAGKWEEAVEMQRHASTFFEEAFRFIEQRCEGFIDPVFDKGLAVASGHTLGHQRCRAPYTGWSDDTTRAFGMWLKECYPEFVCSQNNLKT